MPDRYIFRGAELLVVPDGTALAEGEVELPAHAFGDCLVVDWPRDLALPEGAEARGLRGLFATLAPETFALAGKAFQLLGWVRTHQFCGTCGHPLALPELVDDWLHRAMGGR